MDAAWVGASGILVGAVVTQGFNLWNDGRRTAAQAVERQRDRQHDLHVRHLEIVRARQDRLYADRRAAYAEFRRAYNRFHRLAQERSRVVSKARSPAERPSDNQSHGDRTNQRVIEIDMKQEREMLQEALLSLEAVASLNVQQAGVSLIESIDLMLGCLINASLDEERGLMDSVRFNDHLRQWLDRYESIRQADEAFLAAVRLELELDGGMEAPLA